MMLQLRRSPRLPQRTPGRATIELAYLASGQVNVTVTRLCDRPMMQAAVRCILDSIQKSPEITLCPFDAEDLMRKRRRGGPPAPPETEKLRVVQGWMRVQGRMNQEVYVNEQGISPATLRRWTRELERDGKL
jgi:hypothetical protein